MKRRNKPCSVYDNSILGYTVLWGRPNIYFLRACFSHYDPALIARHRNFIDNWRCVQDAYDQRFQRMWAYYLLSCAGSFRARRNQLWQIVFSKNCDDSIGWSNRHWA
jgi:cyclopropane-fatty-acyl-phospholipid synthase